MDTKPLYIASCSFGKDSVATILLAIEHNEPLDRVVFVEVMFDHERGISGEDPTHIEWVHRVAIPKLEKMGVKVDIVKSDADYIGWVAQPMSKSSKPERVGKKRVWLLQGRCSLNRDGKLAAIPNKVSENFNKRYTFTELEARMDLEDKKIAFNEAHKQQTLF